LLLLGHTANEINVLQKTMIAMGQAEPHAVPLVKGAEIGQLLIIMRLLIGKLHEGWLLIKKRAQGDPAVRMYLDQMRPEGIAALERLKKHFGKQSPLTLIRHRLAFHNADCDDLIEANFLSLSDDEPWEFFVGDTVSNTFHYASELVVSRAAVGLMQKNSTPKDFVKMCTLVGAAANDLMQVCMGLIRVILKVRFPNVPEEKVDLGNVEPLSELRLSFFSDPT
jgi:hypothetical protein